MQNIPINELEDLKEQDFAEEISSILSKEDEENLPKLYEESLKNFEIDTIIKGTILEVSGDDVIVDIGYKSEGIISKTEFKSDAPPELQQDIDIFLEAIEDESGQLNLSKVKADRIKGWEDIINNKAEGDVVSGRVIRKIKGGLLVDVSVPVFLPASQVDIRRVEDIASFVGKTIEAKIIKIDREKMNIIISRRKLLEEIRDGQKKGLLERINEGDIINGIVKNIADFGAFVDLGGIDGLLHITDMSWGRISHPSEVVALEEAIDVKILKIDAEKERIALGLKQLSQNPWEGIEGKYPVGSKIQGKVVNILPYGAFIELETGVEGLVHVSEMSWTKRVNHPLEVVAIGDIVEVVILKINSEAHEISLGMKQVEANPWELLKEKYPVNTTIEGRVRNMTSYGAFIEIEEGIDGLLHISDMSWTKKVTHPSEIVKKGEKIQALILSIDSEKKRVALGLKQLKTNPWLTDFSEKYKIGTVHSGKITKLANFGAFIELEEELEGLLHISKIGDESIESMKETLNIGDVIEVQVIKYDPDERRIGLKLTSSLDDLDNSNVDSENTSASTVESATKSEENELETQQEATTPEPELEAQQETAKSDETNNVTGESSDDMPKESSSDVETETDKDI